MSAQIETLYPNEVQLTSGTIDLRYFHFDKNPNLFEEIYRKGHIPPKELPSSQERETQQCLVHFEQGGLVYLAEYIQQFRRSFSVPVGIDVPSGIGFGVPVDISLPDIANHLKMPEFFSFPLPGLQQERVIKSLRERVDIVTDEAEVELQMDKILSIGVNKIIDRINSELKTENIDCSVILEVFHDVEVENWDSFEITIKSENPTIPHKQLLMLWDKLSLSVAEETNKLVSQGEITESEQDHIQSKLVISVEVD